MLCAKCHEREATVHKTVIDGDKVTKTDFCEECAGRDLRSSQRPSDVAVHVSPFGTLQINRGLGKNSMLTTNQLDQLNLNFVASGH